MDLKTPSHNGSRTHFHQKIDLSTFNLETGNIRALSDQAVRLTISSVPARPRIVTQVLRVLDPVPDEMYTGHSLTQFPSSGGKRELTPVEPTTDPKERRQNLATSLRRPNGQLTMRLIARIKTSDSGELDQIEQHPDAPKFYDFAQDVKALDPPMSVMISQSFVGDVANRDTLRIGSASSPGVLQLTFPSSQEAISFAKLLARYKRAECASK